MYPFHPGSDILNALGGFYALNLVDPDLEPLSLDTPVNGSADPSSTNNVSDQAGAGYGVYLNSDVKLF